MNRRTLVSMASPFRWRSAWLRCHSRWPSRRKPPGLESPVPRWPGSPTSTSTTRTANSAPVLRRPSSTSAPGRSSFSPHVPTQRPSTSSQRGTSPGVFRCPPSPGDNLVWGGDRHGHWQVRDLENHELDRLDNGPRSGRRGRAASASSTRLPSGLSLPGAPANFRSTRPEQCAAQNNQRCDQPWRMGISVGWGDRYGTNLPDLSTSTSPT